MSLSSPQRRYLRSHAHHLNPVVLLGTRGVTPMVLKALNEALNHHELVKVKLSGSGKVERNQQIDTLIDNTGAENVHSIGYTVVLFRRNRDKPGLALPQ